MTELWENACALWFHRHLLVDFEIYGREYDAAAAAAYMAEYEHGVPIGVQFSDGRTIKVEDWQAFKDAEERLQKNQETIRAMPPRKTRLILNPFDGSPKRVDFDEPMWLGIRPEILINQSKTV